MRPSDGQYKGYNTQLTVKACNPLIYSQHLSSVFVSAYSVDFFSGTKDKNMRFLRMLLNCPVKIRECNFTDEVNNMAIRSTEISTITQKQLIFDAMGVLLLLVAGADVIIPSR